MKAEQPGLKADVDIFDVGAPSDGVTAVSIACPPSFLSTLYFGKVETQKVRHRQGQSDHSAIIS